MNADPFDLARAEAMLRGYDARWGEEMADRYVVLAVEAEFRAPLVNPDTGAPSRTWTLGGKLDVVVRNLVEQRNDVVEHKTATGDVGPGSDYVKRLRLDGQVSVYYAGGDALGFPIDGCLYDVLVKPAQRPLRATPIESRKFTKAGALYATQRDRDETVEEYRDRVLEAVASDPNGHLVRAEVVRLEQEMKDAMADVWGLGVSMREAARAGRYPRNPDACVRYGRTCEFFGVCTGEASLDDTTAFRRSEQLHPELSDNADGSLLTSSRLSAYRACPRLHHLRYDLGYRPAIEADTLRFGSLIHKGLEAWWKAPNGERLEAALAAITTQPIESTAEAVA
jgi:hypothetical protein